MIRIRCFAPKISAVQCRENWLYGLLSTASLPEADLNRAWEAKVTLAVMEGKEPLFAGPDQIQRMKQIDRELQAMKATERGTLEKEARRTLQALTGKSSVATLPRESFEEFYRLPRDQEAARRFLLKYGAFSFIDLHRSPDLPGKIAKLWDKAVRQRKKPFALPLEFFWHEQEKLKALLQISHNLSLGRPEDLEKAEERASALGYPSARSAIRLEMISHLRPVWVTLDFERNSAKPALAVFQVLPGIYAHLWNSFAEKLPWGMCARCGVLFVVSRPAKKYCSRSHEQAAKQQRYRERLAGKEPKRR